MGKLKKETDRSTGQEQAAAVTVQFPIGVKLVSIISLLLILFLGLITVLVSVMVSRDVQLTAEDTNYTINKRTALSAGNTLETVYSNVLFLLNNLTALNRVDLLEAMESQSVDYFYRYNQNIGAVFVRGAVGRENTGRSELFINKQFMVANRLMGARVEAYINTQVEAVSLAREGEFLLFNVTPFLESAMMEMIFPWKNGDIDSAVGVFFSLDSLKETFSDTVNPSFLINGLGDVLAGPDAEMVAIGANMSNQPFVKNILESGEQNIQTTYQDEEGQDLFVAYQRLSLGNAVAITIIPAKTVFEGITATTRRTIYLSAGILILSIVFILIFARSLSKPLTELTQAAKMIEEGYYHLDLKTEKKDEIGILAGSFMSMSRGLISFEKFTNKTLTRLARSGKLVTGGADRKATIFFSDIRGFTAISEKLKPDEIVEFLNDYMDRMVYCVHVTGGVVDKFIGDAVMAHWGAVESTGSPEQDALNCVKSALMMRASLRAFNRGRGEDKKPVIKIGCGINSGDLVAGQIGSDERMEYTVIGDAVSFADRTETFNKPFGTEILITESTWQLCGDYLITSELPSVTERGKKVRMFAVVNMRDPHETDDLLRCLDGMPKTNRKITRQCVGTDGPQTLAEVRTLLGTPTPDLSKVNTDEEEKKYNISTPLQT
ncbi:MAG: HAMP domain-containing protein [Treponema sp.]|jgi:adenylate cyclase|nr:HAMP domain-containing protein [Treponema sp.]